jgi:hypothetical protein
MGTEVRAKGFWFMGWILSSLDAEMFYAMTQEKGIKN